MLNKVIVSMATMPCRKERLSENIESILNQSYKFDILLINVNNNVTDEDMLWYNEFSKQDDRIIINRADDKWKSCNKLLPALKIFPNNVIITIDDDVYYPIDSLKELIYQYIKTPKCIITHETNPLYLKDNKINYLLANNIKIQQKEWSKYLSNCTLFPPNTFDNSDLFDYDKMMYCTNGTHDELWFWINSTLNNIKCVATSYIRSFECEIKTPWKLDEFRLCTLNNNYPTMELYSKNITELYGERLLNIIKNNKTEFILTKDNVQHFCLAYNMIKILYNYGFIVNTDSLTKSWKKTVEFVMEGNKFLI